MKRKEPRPPIRVEALLPRWAQVTRAASVVSGGLQVLPWTVASTLPWAQSDRPTGLSQCRNVVLQTTIDHPFESIPSATAITSIGRCANGSAPLVSVHLLPPLYQLASTCTSSPGTLCFLYLRTLSFRTDRFWEGHASSRKEGDHGQMSELARPAGSLAVPRRTSCANRSRLEIRREVNGQRQKSRQERAAPPYTGRGSPAAIGTGYVACGRGLSRDTGAILDGVSVPPSARRISLPDLHAVQCGTPLSIKGVTAGGGRPGTTTKGETRHGGTNHHP